MRRFALALATCLTIAACGTSAASPAPSSEAAPATVATTAESAPTTSSSPTATTPPALQLSAPLVGGGTIDLAQFGGQPLMLWFWAPTCQVCRREAPNIAALSAELDGRANIVGVAWSGDDDAFQGFIDEHGFSFPTISDPNGEVFATFGITSQPAAVFVRADGTLAVARGVVERSAILDALGV